jgi:hypothetical protein
VFVALAISSAAPATTVTHVQLDALHAIKHALAAH